MKIITYQNILCLFLIYHSISLFSQNIFDTQQFASGYSKTYYSPTHFSLDHPASLATLSTNWKVNINNEQRFFSGISASSFSISKTSDNQGFAVSLREYGIEEWRHVGISIAYGRKLFDLIDIGIQFSGSQLQIEEFLNESDLNISGSMLIHLSQNHKISLIGLHLNTMDRSNDPSYHLGYLYTLSKKVTLGIELNNREDVLNSSIYLYYSPVSTIDLSLAYNSVSLGPIIGLHYDVMDQFSISLAVSPHQRLGYSGSFGMAYLF